MCHALLKILIVYFFETIVKDSFLFVLIVIVLLRCLFVELIEFKCFSVLFPDILACSQTVKVENEMKHLFVCLVMVERNYWNSIVNLIGEGVDRVVYDDHVFHSPVCDNP